MLSPLNQEIVTKTREKERMTALGVRTEDCEALVDVLSELLQLVLVAWQWVVVVM